MNLDALFRDFEARLAAQHQQIIEADAKETSIAEFAKVTHLDRLAGSIGLQIFIQTRDDRKWTGAVETVGLGWIQIQADYGSVLIPVSSVLWWEAKTGFTSVDTGQVSRKLSFAFALRAIARSRSEVKIYLLGGHEFEGRLERVGGDFIEIKTSPTVLRGSFPKVQSRVIPLTAVDAVTVTN